MEFIYLLPSALASRVPHVASLPLATASAHRSHLLRLRSLPVSTNAAPLNTLQHQTTIILSYDVIIGTGSVYCTCARTFIADSVLLQSCTVRP